MINRGNFTYDREMLEEKLCFVCKDNTRDYTIPVTENVQVEICIDCFLEKFERGINNILDEDHPLRDI